MDQKVKCFIILLRFTEPCQLISVLINLADWYSKQNRQGWLTHGFVRTGNFSGEYFFNSTLDSPESIANEIEKIFIDAGFTTLGPFPICHQCSPKEEPK